MTGYWPNSASRSNRKHTKKEQGHYPGILTVQAWSIKDLLLASKRPLSCNKQQVIPSVQCTILPGEEANHRTGFGSSCLPSHGASHIINIVNNFLFVCLFVVRSWACFSNEMVHNV